MQNSRPVCLAGSPFFKFGVLALLAALLIVFAINLYSNHLEIAKLNEYYRDGFAVDVPIYGPPIYHFLAFWIFLSVIFAKRYVAALCLTLFYGAVHCWAGYERVQGCFLGGDICPPDSITTKILARYTWTDWFATFTIPLILIWFVYMFYISRSKGEPALD